jgi:hypothetical protein
MYSHLAVIVWKIVEIAYAVNSSIWTVSKQTSDVSLNVCTFTWLLAHENSMAIAYQALNGVRIISACSYKNNTIVVIDDPRGLA